jgi:magnesium-protoporphyrin O-methyltransferase
MMSCCHCQGAQRVFSGRYVARNLKHYRRKGPDKTTRVLVDALVAEGVEGATLLDVGGGVGAIEYELLNAGAARATNAEAATGYIEAAREETAPAPGRSIRSPRAGSQWWRWTPSITRSTTPASPTSLTPTSSC